MLVRALEACFIDGQRRRKDAVFEFSGELPQHLVAFNDGEPSAKLEEPSPVALSQMAMADTKPKSFVDAVVKSKSKSGPEKV
jgi:hypothetical protein